MDKRSHLRELARNFCNSVLVSSTLQDGLERIRNSSNCDVIYVSSRFDLELATQFIASSKQTEAGRDSANLLIGSVEPFTESVLARLMLKGFDGMLIEPASVDTFRVSAELALKARKEKLHQRKKKSLDIMVRALADQLDELASKKKLRQITILAQDRFSTLGKEIAALDFDSKGLYFDSLIEHFIARNAPIQSELEYSGSSQRMQRRRLNK
jgi:hypothetical protein